MKGRSGCPRDRRKLKEDALDILLLPQADHHRLHRYLTYRRADRRFRTRNGVLLDTREMHEAYAAAVLHLPS